MISIFKSSKLFISTSHEEGWGISVCEALASNAICVTYDLDAFKYWHEFLYVTPKHDIQGMAINIQNLLDNSSLKKSEVHKKHKQDFLKSVDWDSIAKKELISFLN